MKDFSISEALKFGFEKTKKNFWFLAAVTVVYGAVSFLPSKFNIRFDEQNPDWTALMVFLIFSLAASIVRMLVDMGLIRIALDYSENKKPELMELFSQGDLILKYILGGFLTGLIIIGGLILFIVPGIIFAIRLSFVSYLIIDQKAGPVEAVKKSWNLTRGVALKLFLFGIVNGLLNIVGAMLLVVGLFVTFPTTNLATAHIFRKLLKANQ